MIIPETWFETVLAGMRDGNKSRRGPPPGSKNFPLTVPEELTTVFETRHQEPIASSTTAPPAPPPPPSAPDPPATNESSAKASPTFIPKTPVSSS